jgi:hypothetical protein
VFNIGGNKFRLIAYLQFDKQVVYVKTVLTHKEYDKGGWKSLSTRHYCYPLGKPSAKPPTLRQSAMHNTMEASGVDTLRILMQQHGLHQSDLPEIGSQGVVSEILSGQRDLNLRQARALSLRFGVNVATFIG